MTEPPPTRWRRVVRPLLPGLAATALIALLCNLALELTGLTHVRGNLWNYKTPAFVGLFLLGTVVVWALVGLVHAVVGRLRVTAALAATATAVVAVIDYEKMRLRREPVYPSDWAFAGDIGFLTDVVGLRAALPLVLAVLVTGVVGFSAAHAALRWFERPERRSPEALARGGRVAVRGLTAAICLVTLGYVSQFNSPGNVARGAYEAVGASWTPWSQQRNYLGNGFVGGFLYNLQVPKMEQPAGYSADEMARITARYARAAERINRTRDRSGLRDVNVVMVLSESFSDPEALDGVHLPEDPIPFTRQLADSTMSGRMLAGNVGGGTANMEFEALTGMSLSQFPPQTTVPYQMLVPDYDTFPSAVGWFKQMGHRAVAIHPFTTEMYRRREVYRTFGFDEFVWGRNMKDRRLLQRNPYISDASAYEELRSRLESERGPVFLHLVTMQNHIPYPEKYDDAPTVTGPGGEPLTEVGQYVRGLSYSDDALKGLVGALRRSEEKTVLVFYGDHLPGIYPDSVYQANGRRAMHETPFLVWANFPGPGGQRPTTSPTHFMDLLLERTDTALPPYYALLHELRQELPAMDSGMLVDGRDRSITPGLMSERAAGLLRDYRLVQYDLSVGARHSAEEMFEAPTGHPADEVAASRPQG